MKLRVTGAKSIGSGGFVITLDRVEIPDLAANNTSTNCTTPTATVSGPTFQPPTNTPSGVSSVNATAAPTLAVSPCSQETTTVANQAAVSSITAAACAPITTTTNQGLIGRYFNSMNIDPTTFAVSRTDSQVDFNDLLPHPPLPNEVTQNNFSIVWTGKVWTDYSDLYTFSTTTDDGVRLWVNNKLLIDKWSDGVWNNVHSDPISLAAGKYYNIRMDYYENGVNLANAHLYWNSSCQTGGTDQVIPSTHLVSTMYPKALGLWNPSTFTYSLTSTNSGTSMTPDITAVNGSGFLAYPLAGDWDGDGRDSVGIFDILSQKFKLYNDIVNINHEPTLNITGQQPDYTFPPAQSYQSGDIPIVGRWTAESPHDGLGIYRPSTHTFYLQTGFVQAAPEWTRTFQGIDPTDTTYKPVIGDWNGDGIDTLGLFHPSDMKFYLSDQIVPTAPGVVDDVSAQRTFTLQNTPGNIDTTLVYPIATDWGGQGFDGVGIEYAGIFYIKRDIGKAAISAAAYDVKYTLLGGLAGEMPVLGQWSNVDDEIKRYGVVLTNATTLWSAAEKKAVLAGVRDTADVLHQFAQRDPFQTKSLADYFKQIMGTDQTPITMTRSSATAPSLLPGACNTGRDALKTITCYTRAAPINITQYSIVYGLGVIFDWQSGIGPSGQVLTSISDTINMSNNLLDCTGQSIMGYSTGTGDPWTRGERGWGTGSGKSSASAILPLTTDYQQYPLFYTMKDINNRTPTVTELIQKTAPDMFLNWAYRRLSGFGINPNPCMEQQGIFSNAFLNLKWFDPQTNVHKYGRVPGDADSTIPGGTRYGWMNTLMQGIFAAHGW